jgi:hypothetical protein
VPADVPEDWRTSPPCLRRKKIATRAGRSSAGGEAWPRWRVDERSPRRLSAINPISASISAWLHPALERERRRPYDAELPTLLDRAKYSLQCVGDTAYRSAKAEKRIARYGQGLEGPFPQAQRPPNAAARKKANAARSKIRSAVEHVFADQKHRMALFVRTIGIERATTKIGMANLAYNLRRLVFLAGRTAPA